jgi:hypothetical protein
MSIVLSPTGRVGRWPDPYPSGVHFSPPTMTMLIALPILVGAAARFAADDTAASSGWLSLLAFAGIAIWCTALAGWLPASVSLPAAVIGGSLAGLAFIRAAPKVRRARDDDRDDAPATPIALLLDWQRFDRLRAQWAKQTEQP